MPAANKPVANDISLVIERTFDAPRPLVFAAWAEGARMSKWAAPHGFTVPQGFGDAAPGAKWRCCMRKPDGVELWLGGTYREVVRDERIVFTHSWDDANGKPGAETLITVMFADAGAGKTRMTFKQEFFTSVASRDGHRVGWMQSFERLDDLLVGMKKEKSRG